MTLSQLLARLRIDLDDTEQDYLWSDADLKSYINEAQEQAVRRARLIIDSSTSAVCNVTVVANTASYTLNSKIYRVLDVIPSWNGGDLLRKWTTKELSLRNNSWHSETSKTPDAYLLDYESGKIRLYPKPTQNGTLTLRVYRLPLQDMVADSDTPEIAEHYHKPMLHYARFLAYMKPDADTQDKAKAQEAEALFALEFGEQKSAWSDEYDNRNLPDDLMDGQY